MSGMKENEGKPPMAWLAGHWRALGEMAKVTEFGAKKYEPNNWLKGIDPRLLYDAMFRHAFKSADGEELDPEHGFDHLAAVAWNALTLLEYKKRGIHPDGIHVSDVVDADPNGNNIVQVDSEEWANLQRQFQVQDISENDNDEPNENLMTLMKDWDATLGDGLEGCESGEWNEYYNRLEQEADNVEIKCMEDLAHKHSMLRASRDRRDKAIRDAHKALNSNRWPPLPSGTYIEGKLNPGELNGEEYKKI